LNDRKPIERKNEQELPLRERAASPSKLVMMREDLRICKSGVKNHPTRPMMPVLAAHNCLPGAVDIQDNPTAIHHQREPSSELQLDK